jgi:Flp pilus assembly protein TadD
LSEALRLNPDQPVARANLGAIYKLRGNFPEARRLLEDAIRHMPENAFAHGDLCVILVKTGHREQAMPECREALRLNPALGEPRFTLAEELAAQGDRYGAAEEYSRLLVTHPSYPGAREALEKLQ